MPHYKDSSDNLYWLDDPENVHLLRSIVTPITDDEADSIRKAHIIVSSVQDQLSTLDFNNQLTQRNLRETIMLMSAAFKQLSGGVLDLSTIPGVAKVYAVESEAAALRTKLK